MVAKRRLAGARPGAEKMYRSINKMLLSPLPIAGGEESMKGGKRRGVPVKTLKKLLKKAGLKTSGKKAALTRRAKKAKLMMKGGLDGMMSDADKALDKPLEFEDDTTAPPPTAPPPTSAGRKSKSRGKKGMSVYY
jgi:hypothetical protein